MNTPKSSHIHSERHLRAVPTPQDSLKDKLKKVATPRRIGGVVLATVLGVGSLIYATHTGEVPKDPRTEQNSAREVAVLSPLFAKDGRVELPYKKEGMTFNQMRGTVTITRDEQLNPDGSPVTLKVRSTPDRQRDLDNDVPEDSNASILVGELGSAYQDARTVTFTNPVMATGEDGNTFYGGLLVKPGETDPDPSAAQDPASMAGNMFWVDGTTLSQESSGVDMQIQTVGPNASLHSANQMANPAIETGPYGVNLPTLIIT